LIVIKSALELQELNNKAVHSKAEPTINVNERLLLNDETFDWLYPEPVEAISKKHWTPLAVAQRAAEFLAEPGKTVLDIGSGAGKFCLAAAYYQPECYFFGVEQRHELVDCAYEAKFYMRLNNVNFLCANITQIDFKKFDNFYFYNAFFENIETDNAIDDTIATSYSLYAYYTRYLYNQLERRPSGTRLVTFHSFGTEVPHSYQLADIANEGFLKMWIKR